MIAASLHARLLDRITSSAGLSASSAVALGLLPYAMAFALLGGCDIDTDPGGPIASLLGPYLPVVWAVWFAGIGAAFALIWRRDEGFSTEVNLLIALFCLCALYPLYTLGFRSRAIGLIGNMIGGVLDAFIVVRLSRIDRIAALCVAPIVPWLVLASVWLIFDIRGVPF